MVLSRSNGPRVGMSYDNRTASLGSLESCYLYERKKVPTRCRLGGDAFLGGHASFNTLDIDHESSNVVVRRNGSVKDLKSLFDHDGSRTPSESRKASSTPGSTPTSAIPPTLVSRKQIRQGDITMVSYQHDASQNTGHTGSKSSTANATFDLEPNIEATRRPISWNRLSPEVTVLQKRLAEMTEKLRNQEARHIQERLAWQAQTMELQRIRKERDRLLEDQTEQRRQLSGTHTIAEAVMAENKQLRSICSRLQPEVTLVDRMDWEVQLNQLLHENAMKDAQIVGVKYQLEEKSMELQRESELNTEFVIQLNEAAGELRRQSSQKDLRIGILAAQLDEKDQQLRLESELNTEIVATLRANEQELRRQSSQKDLTIEQLMSELHESRGQLQIRNDCSTKKRQDSMDEEWIKKIQEAQNELKKELTIAKANTLKTMSSVRTKLVEERTKIKRERTELQALKRAVVKESVQSIAVMSGLRGLVEQMQQKITTLEKENAKLRLSSSEQVSS